MLDSSKHFRSNRIHEDTLFKDVFLHVFETFKFFQFIFSFFQQIPSSNAVWCYSVGLQREWGIPIKIGGKWNCIIKIFQKPDGF